MPPVPETRPWAVAAGARGRSAGAGWWRAASLRPPRGRAASTHEATGCRAGASRYGLWDVLGEPEAAGRFAGEGAEDHLFDAEAPELAGDNGGVGHALAGPDAGDEGGGASSLGEVAERALGEGAGEGPGGYALAGPDAGQLREELGTVDVLLVYGCAEGADVADGDDEGRCIGQGGLVVGRALDRTPPRPIGLHQDHVGEAGEGGDGGGLYAADAVLREQPAADHDPRRPVGEYPLGLGAQLVWVLGRDERAQLFRLAHEHLGRRGGE